MTIDNQTAWALAQGRLLITACVRKVPAAPIGWGRATGPSILVKRAAMHTPILAVSELFARAGRCGTKTGVISVTSKSRYAVVAMAELARSGDRPVPIKELAERRSIPEQFLEQLFSTLRRAGLLTSHRGMKGGYTLSRPADEIDVLEVVQALDGKVGQEADEAGGIWADGVGALRNVFSRTTIAEISRREAEEAGSGMYYI